MNILDKIYNFLKAGINKQYSDEKQNMFFLLHVILFLGGILNTFFGIIQILFYNKIIGSVTLGIGLIFLLSITINKVKNYKNLASFAIIITSLEYFLLILTGGANDSAILWGILYPAIVMFFFKQKTANIYSIIFIISVIAFFIISPQNNFFADYSIELKMRFVAVYLALYISFSVYKYVNVRLLNKKNKQFMETQNSLKNRADFISKLSFQVRTPLNNIVGILNLKSEQQRNEVVDEIEVAVNKLVSIVNSIPEFSESKLQLVKATKVEFNINNAVRNSIKLYNNDNYRNLKFNINFSNGLPNRVIGNVLMTKQVILSIIDYIYTQLEGSNVKIDIVVTEKEKSNNDIIFKIKSNMQLANSIDKIKDKQDFMLIENLVKDLNGRLNIYSEDNSCIFLYSLPFLLPTKKKIVKKINVKKIPIKKNSLALKEASVLLVEDDVVNQKVMDLNLRKLVKKVDIAENGKLALDKIGTNKYDIILMDIGMPLMDGFKTTQKIREIEVGTGSRIPIIAVTAFALAGDREKCLNAGMDAYISKPFDIDKLIETMKTHLGSENL